MWKKWEAEEQNQEGGVWRILPWGERGWAKGARAAAGEARFRSLGGGRGGGGGEKTGVGWVLREGAPCTTCRCDTLHVTCCERDLGGAVLVPPTPDFFLLLLLSLFFLSAPPCPF